MIKSRKLRFVMVLISICTCGLVLGAEPNEAKIELKYEISDDEQEWLITDKRGNIVKDKVVAGPIKPTHVAELFTNSYLPSAEILLNTSAGKNMSERQRRFLTTTAGTISRIGPYDKPIRGYRHFRLYAISEDDAKKMAQAMLEYQANELIADYERCLTQRKELEEKVADIKKELPEKQKQAKAAESKCMEIKDSRYFSLHDSEAIKKAKETMLQMDKMLDVLEIELAGILEKLKAIEWYRNSKNLIDMLKYRHFPDEIMSKLDQMFVEQMIERRSVEARKKAALKIQSREKGFLDLFSQKSSLEARVRTLRKSLNDSERRLDEIERFLSDMGPEDKLVPKVFQNKVTIYPVRVRE